MRFIVWGTIPVGSILGGVVATIFGLRTAIWVGAAGMVLALVPLLLSPVRSLRDMPTPAEDPVDPAAGVEDASTS
jgi:hypothetical protein